MNVEFYVEILENHIPEIDIMIGGFSKTMIQNTQAILLKDFSKTMFQKSWTGPQIVLT